MRFNALQQTTLLLFFKLLQNLIYFNFFQLWDINNIMTFIFVRQGDYVFIPVRIMEKPLDGFQQNLLEGCNMGQGGTPLILVYIRF